MSHPTQPREPDWRAAFFMGLMLLVILGGILVRLVFWGAP